MAITVTNRSECGRFERRLLQPKLESLFDRLNGYINKAANKVSELERVENQTKAQRVNTIVILVESNTFILKNQQISHKISKKLLWPFNCLKNRSYFSPAGSNTVILAE